MIYLMIQSSRSIYDVQGSIMRFYLDVKNGRELSFNDLVIFENTLVVKQCVFEYWYNVMQHIQNLMNSPFSTENTALTSSVRTTDTCTGYHQDR